MRIVNFADGAESETTPVIGNIKASALIEYPDDATYEATEQGAPAEGNLYFNTTDKTIRYYNGTTWQEIIDENTVQAVENKAIDADTNMITNIDNNEIKTGAAIDVTKLHDGTVDNTEFGHLDGVTSNIQTQLDTKQNTSEKGIANGYASLDGSGTVPSTQLPSYVDDVEEYADFASLPVTGESGKIYITIDDNKQYRWTGSAYIDISGKVDSVNTQTGVVVLDTDDIAEGTNKYANGSIDTHSDVDVTTVVPVIGDNLQYDGSNFVPVAAGSGGAGFKLVSSQVFESSGTWTKPADVTAVVVEVVGGGGAGGGTPSTGASQMVAGGGGGSGGYSKRFITAGLGATETVTVGAGGLGVAAGTGGTGGTTSFGAFIDATGGNGGTSTSASSSPRVTNGGQAGVGGSGDFNAKGGSGHAGFTTGTVGVSGAGGNSIWGGGGVSRVGIAATAVTPGQAGGNYGAGGSGGLTGQNQSPSTGASGDSGIVIIWEYE